MPSKSKKQHNLMALVANDPKAAKRLGIPQSVGRDFMKADKGRKFGSGGSMKESKAMMRKEVAFMKKKGAPKSMIKHEEAEMGGKMKKGVKKMQGGGYIPRSLGGSGPPPGATQTRLGARSISKEEMAYNARNRVPPGGYKAADEIKLLHQFAKEQNLPQTWVDRQINLKMRTPIGSGAPSGLRGGRLGAALTAVGALSGLGGYLAGKKSKTSVEAEPENVSAEAAKSGVKAVPGASRGGGGGAPPMAPRGMGPIMPMMPMMPEKRGKVTVEEVKPEGKVTVEEIGKARGGKIQSHKASKGPFRHAADGVAHKGKTKGRVVKMREGGMAYSSGGSVFRKSADGIASKGKTKGHMVKMRYGGEC